jgi:hypothetical protein
MDRDDVGVGEGRSGAHLAQEALVQRGVGSELHREDLERHRTVELQVAREIHRTHPAASQLALEGVPIGELASDVRQIGRRHERWERSGKSTGADAAAPLPSPGATVRLFTARRYRSTPSRRQKADAGRAFLHPA